MAKRKRLFPTSLTLSETNSVLAKTPALETKAFLRPGLGAPAPIARVAGDSSAHAALSEMSEAITRARVEGRLVLSLPLGQIEVDHLVRDRISLDEEALAPLVASLREHGQRTPIEVTELGPDRFGLISGWRRIQALSRLFSETGEACFGEVQALLRRPETSQDAYISMVEENEIRLGLSYYERARIVAQAVDTGVFVSEKHALQRLFSTASRARRSKIGSFLSIYRPLDDVLRFPSAIPERLGLALAKALVNRSSETVDLAAELATTPAPDAQTEQARLAQFVSGKKTVGSLITSRKHPRKLAGKELRPGVFLAATDVGKRPVLTLSGPRVDTAFREELECWLAARG